ncbi:hypothetical protein WICPIJ_007422 [Wickerhamomyces pijperi]|uniref:Secreted protein n=1 Tax=Wickerhamomyces pijperi TaxID=599730 RepID=A0A9P8PZU1_WICPI|nr:hypothetical protein WICPIJ_007422 [Wickerhamomyces pijperi]
MVLLALDFLTVVVDLALLDGVLTGVLTGVADSPAMDSSISFFRSSFLLFGESSTSVPFSVSSLLDFLALDLFTGVVDPLASPSSVSFAGFLLEHSLLEMA